MYNESSNRKEISVFSLRVNRVSVGTGKLIRGKEIELNSGQYWRETSYDTSKTFETGEDFNLPEG